VSDGAYYRCLSPNHRLESCQSNIQCRHCHGEHNSLLHLEATGGRNRAVQRVGISETAVTSEETTRKDGPDNVVNIDGPMAGKLETSRTVQLASARVQLISNLEEESISTRTLLNSISDASFVTKRTLFQYVLQRQQIHITVFGLLEIRIVQPRQVISPRVSHYSSRSVLWSLEFILSKWTSAEVGQSVNKKNWTHLLTIQSDVLDNVESLKIDVLDKIKVYPTLMRDEYSHGCGESLVNHPAMLDWVPGLARALGTLQSSVEGFHTTWSLDCVNRYTDGIWKSSHLGEVYPRTKRITR